MRDVRVVMALPCHIDRIADNVREPDRAELWAAACKTPKEVLEGAIENCDAAWTAFVDGIPICMFGVTGGDPLSGVGIPWMVGTHQLDRMAHLFLRRCREQVQAMSEAYPLLRNYIDNRNGRAIRWLEWLGFEMGPPVPYGPFRALFRGFQMIRRQHV